MTTFAYTSGDPSHLSASQNASMADIQGPFVDLRTFLNGNISDINLSASAAISEAKLAVGSSGLAKGAFRAYRNAVLTRTTGQVVVFDADTGAGGFDVSGWYDTTTGLFTPQVAGYYSLSWCIGGGFGIAADTAWQSQLRKNGAVVAAGQQGYQRGGATAVNSVGSDAQIANGSTDNFDVIIVHNAGVGTTVINGAAATYFTGQLIGRS